MLVIGIQISLTMNGHHSLFLALEHQLATRSLIISLSVVKHLIKLLLTLFVSSLENAACGSGC